MATTRRQAPWAFATAAVLVLTVGISAYSWFAVTNQPELPEIPLTDEQKADIQNYLETADLYISMGYLASPPGDSALDQYDKILKIDPTNLDAIDGKKDIASRYLALAKIQFEKGDYDRSLNLIKTGLFVEPKNEKLQSLQQEVQEKRTNN